MTALSAMLFLSNEILNFPLLNGTYKLCASALAVSFGVSVSINVYYTLWLSRGSLSRAPGMSPWVSSIVAIPRPKQYILS